LTDEELEALAAMPIRLEECEQGNLLPARYQHLSDAISRLASRGVIVLLSNGGGARWARAKPWEG
jgi:hypothetical protein